MLSAKKTTTSGGRNEMRVANEVREVEAKRLNCNDFCYGKILTFRRLEVVVVEVVVVVVSRSVHLQRHLNRQASAADVQFKPRNSC